MTSFIGRSRELDELRSLFRQGKRLVTLVGIGGIGKTRLALELGWSASDLGWANVYLVELASLTPDMVDDAVLESVGGGSSRSSLQAAVEYLRDATTLLVLDCCEHVLDAVRHVAEVLLRRCPSVTILATSRSPIKVAGELVWAVPPLSMQARGDVGETGASDAARLFADRASYVQSRFELSESTAGAVETIVRRVDGVPLAIELAAARVRVLSPEEIADGLDDHLRVLRGGHRSDPRHQTIRASLDWSHELLTDRERQLFARLSVFSGSFDLEAAAAVCAGDASVRDQVLDEIEGLVDNSPLSVERTSGAATRFRMLDFVRQYAAERLAAAGEEFLLAGRHRAYFRELAERADRELWALTPAGRARLDDESPNLRAAIDHGCDRAPDDALAMAGALGLYWRVRGREAEGVAAIEQSLDVAPPEPSAGQALALAKLSVLSFWLGDFARTQSSATSALEIGAAVGDTRSQSLALSRLGALVILSDPATGDPMLMRAAELARAAGDQVALCDALGSLAISYFCQDDPGAMRGPLEETLTVAEAIGYEDDIRWCLWCLAHTAFSAGDLASARAHGERALAMMPGQDQLSRYFAIQALSLLDAHMGAADAARERAEADLEQSRQEGLLLGTGALMLALGVAALAGGDLDRAAQWATSLYEAEAEVCAAAWQAQEILVAVALARDDSVQAKIHVERLLAAARPLNNPRAQAVARLGLARALLLEGDDQRAESVTHGALKVLMDRGWRPLVIDALDVLADIALFRRQHERAVRLTAASHTQRGNLGLVAFPHVQKRTGPQLAVAGTALGDEIFKNAFEDGSRLSLEDAVGYAQRGRGKHASAQYGWASLSPAERQVAELASQGLSNPDIARGLFMSRNTVKVHLSRAYAKLGVANRTELARLAARHSHDRHQR